MKKRNVQIKSSNGHAYIRSFLTRILLLSAVAITCLGEEDKADLDKKSRLVNRLRDLGHSLTNNLSQWVEQIKDHDQTKRSRAILNLFACSFADKERMKREKVGDVLVAAYGKEERDEIRAGILIVLDVLEHPLLSNLLAKAEKSADPEMRNLVVLIREKRYLEPTIISDPDIKR